jgi:vacuolar-type H+-ATPase subunit I/STV1
VKQAQEAVAKADRKTAEFEEALRQARAEIYREQEQARLGWREQQATELRRVREESTARLRQAKAEIESTAAAERANLAAQTEALAAQIFQRITEGKAA